MSSHTEENECPICLKSLTESEVHTTHCKHLFHKKCFDKLKPYGFNTCPLCRADVALAKGIPNFNDIVNEIRHDSEREIAEQIRLLKLALDIINRGDTVSERKMAAILIAAKGRTDFSIDELIHMFDDDGHPVSPVASSAASGNVSHVASSVASGNVSHVASSAASSDASSDASHSRRPVASHRPVASRRRSPDVSHVASFQLPLPPPSSGIVGQKRNRDPKLAANAAQRFIKTRNKNNSGGKKTKKKGQRTHRRKKNTSRSLYTIK
jgi:hypothetical protein